MVKKETKVVKNSKNKKDEKPETKFHMPSSLSIVLIVLAGVIVLTWILHWAGATYDYYDEGGILVENEPVQIAGILSFGSAIAGGFINAGALIMYLFVLGGFIELMMRTGAMEQGIKTLVAKLEGKEIILIPLLFIIFSLGGTTYGMQEETIGFFILIVPFLILAGFDAMTGLLVILLGTTTGFAASTVNPFAIGSAVDSLPDFENDIVVKTGDAIGARFVIWIIFTMIGVAFVTSYAWYISKKPTASFVAKDYNKNLAWAQKNFGSMDKKDFRKTTRREMIGLILFASAFLIMVIFYLPWGSFFDNYDKAINPDEGGKGYIWPNGLGWLFNGMNYPGFWYFGELITLFLLFTFAIGFTFKMKIKEISSAMWKGAKDILPVAIIIGVARAIPQVMEGTGTDLYLVGIMTTDLKNLSSISFLIIIFLVFLALTCFIPSTSGLASLSMPIIGLLTVDIFGVPDSGVDPTLMIAYMIIMFSIATGIVNMFIPTQAIVLASAEASRVPYLKMLKPVLIYAGILTIFTIGVIAPLLGILARI